MFEGTIIGQYVPGESVVHRLDPRTKLIITIIMMTVVFMASSGWGLALGVGVIFFLIWLTGIPLSIYLRGVRSFRILIIITFGFQLFLVPGEPLLQWNFIHISREGLTLGGLMALRLVVVLLLAQFLTFTTSPMALIDGIEKLLSPLHKVGVPAHEMAMVMSIALRFIPIFFMEADRIIRAQVSRGADFESGNVITRLKPLTSIIVPLFIKAFQRADDLALAMEVRGYQGGEGRTRLREIRLRRLDLLFLSAGLVVALGIRLIEVYA